jgi:hypothetical protein
MINSGVHIHRCINPTWPTYLRSESRNFGIDSGQLRLRGRGLTLMGFLEPSLGFVWGEPIKVRQQKPVDEKYLDDLDEAGPGPLQLIGMQVSL